MFIKNLFKIIMHNICFSFTLFVLKVLKVCEKEIWCDDNASNTNKLVTDNFVHPTFFGWAWKQAIESEVLPQSGIFIMTA